MKANWFLAILVGGLFFSGCTISSSFINLRVVAGDDKDVELITRTIPGVPKVSGESCRPFIIFVPISGRETIGAAVENAILKAPGADALKSVTVLRRTSATFFYNKDCYVAEGIPVKLQRRSR